MSYFGLIFPGTLGCFLLKWIAEKNAESFTYSETGLCLVPNGPTKLMVLEWTHLPLIVVREKKLN